jgi:hypothetical protein
MTSLHELDAETVDVALDTTDNGKEEVRNHSVKSVHQLKRDVAREKD